jgi:hypothetical protein
MTDELEPKKYEVRVGDPLQGKPTTYKTRQGALNAADRVRAQGKRATVWEGSQRSWGGWSWTTISEDPTDA